MGVAGFRESVVIRDGGIWQPKLPMKPTVHPARHSTMEASNSSKYCPKARAGNGPCYTDVMTGGDYSCFSRVFAEPKASFRVSVP